MRSEFISKNAAGDIEKFYNFNKNYQKNIKPKDNQNLRIATMNCHRFESINAEDTSIAAINELFKWFDDNNCDLVAIQEYNSKYRNKIAELAKSNNLYTAPIDFTNYGYMVLSRYPVKTKLTNIVAGDRKAMIIELDYKGKLLRLCNAHLSLFPRDYSKPNSLNYKRSVHKTIEHHKIQLKEILSMTLDIIMGDMNFTPDDPEYDIMQNRGWISQYEKYELPTTPFNTTVDFIFTQDENKKITRVNTWVEPFLMTDHRAVITDIFI